MSEALEFAKNLRVGVSIGDTLDAWNDNLPKDEKTEIYETCWGNPLITEDLIKAYINAGFRVIRIPVSWRNHIGSEPEYKINEAWMNRVYEVVHFCISNGAYCILNVHHEDWNYPYYDNQEKACMIMSKIWQQIADKFADFDEHLIFEGQNEPRKIGTPVEWNGGDEEGWEVVDATNKSFYDTVRSKGGLNATRYLMLPCYGANCTNGIHHISLPKDERVMVSVHAYEPYEFALEIPGRSKWNHDTEKIDSVLKDLKELFLDKGIPVVLGEFGAMNKEGNEEDRAEWVEYYVSKATSIGIPCVWWDNGRFEGKGELFGLFSRKDYRCAYPKIVQGLMNGSKTK